MKKIILSLIFSAVCLNACYLFPGFFVTAANQISGVSGGWTQVGGTSVPGGVMQNFDGFYFENWDMVVDPSGDVLVGTITLQQGQPYVYESRGGGSWQHLGGTPVANYSGSYYCVSVAYSFDGANRIPYCAFSLNNSSNTTYIHAYNLLSGFWPGYTRMIGGHSFIDLVNRQTISLNGPAFFTTDESNIYAFTNISALGQSLPFPQSVYYFEAEYDPLSQYFGAISGLNFQIPVFQLAPGSSIFSIGTVITNMSLNMAGFELVSQPGPLHALVTYIRDSTNIVIMKIESTTNVQMRLFGGQNYSGIDTAYDHTEKVLYIAVIVPVSSGGANRGEVEVYRYNEITGDLTILGSRITSVNASTVKIRHRVGFIDDIYVGVTDADKENSVSIFRFK